MAIALIAILTLNIVTGLSQFMSHTDLIYLLQKPGAETCVNLIGRIHNSFAYLFFVN